MVLIPDGGVGEGGYWRGGKEEEEEWKGCVRGMGGHGLGEEGVEVEGS